MFSRPLKPKKGAFFGDGPRESMQTVRTDENLVSVGGSLVGENWKEPGETM